MPASCVREFLEPLHHRNRVEIVGHLAAQRLIMAVSDWAVSLEMTIICFDFDLKSFVSPLGDAFGFSHP